MSVVDDSVLIIDSTTPLTEEQKKLAYVMFSGQEPIGRPRILVVPLFLTYTDEKGHPASIRETHIEDVAASAEDFFTDPKWRPIGTSQPNLMDHIKTFELADRLGYRSALGYFLPCGTSSTCENAQAEARNFRGNNLKDIYVPLSNFGSGEITLALDQLLASDAKDFGALKDEGDRLTANARIWILPDNLEALRRSGRVSRAKQWVGDLSNTHPIISVGGKGDNFGHFIPVGQVRGNRPEKIAERMVGEAKDYFNGKSRSVACVIDKNMPEYANTLGELASEAFGYPVPVIKDGSYIIAQVVGDAVGMVMDLLDYRG